MPPTPEFLTPRGTVHAVDLTRAEWEVILSIRTLGYGSVAVAVEQGVITFVEKTEKKRYT